MKLNRFLKSIAVISAMLVLVVFSSAGCTQKNRDGETSAVLNPTVVSKDDEVSDNSEKDESSRESGNNAPESDQTDLTAFGSKNDQSNQADTTVVDNKRDHSDQADTTVSENKKDQSNHSSQSSTTKSDAFEATTEKAGYDTENFQTDSSASVTIKNTVVNQCLRIESVGEADGILCVSVTNVSDRDIEYCVLKCKVDKKEAVFSFSVLPKNTSAVAIEQNGMKYKKDMIFSAWSLEEKVDFQHDFALYDEIFGIAYENNLIEIKNLTQNDIDGKIKICYKNLAAENLYDNKAYTVTVTGLKKGEMKQLFPKHFHSENSRIIFIEYDK